MSAAFGPNKLVKSAVQFGSLPTGVNSNWPWQTMLFRPDPFYSPQQRRGGIPSSSPELHGHYGGARRDNPNVSLQNRVPRDHLLLDFFWMPVVEPYAVSSTFSTRGKINMNYQIWPFNYIHRNTALHALLKAERITGILDTKANEYKNYPSNITNRQANYRYYINAKATLNQFERKFASLGEFKNDKSKVFKFPSEICELWLVPETNDLTGVYEPGDLNAAKPGNYTDETDYGKMADWWANRTLTGDNTKEAPYGNLYPRLTTRSNVYKVHMWVQTIQKVASTRPDQFVTDKDLITSEYRGSSIVERNLDTTDPELQQYDYFGRDAFSDVRKSLDFYYTYRVTDVKQFNP
jgi:uncharacterized protein (TIGR02600 family)